MTEDENSTGSFDAEHGISMVRWVFALLGATVALASRSVGGGTGWLSAAAVSAIVLAVPAIWSRIARAIGRAGERPVPVVVLQIVDSAMALGLVTIVSDIAPNAAWALLAVPIMIASLRVGAAGVLWVWTGTVGAYLGLVWLDVIEQESGLAGSLALERPGILLAVAACSAILTRWLQLGWAIQAEQTAEASARLRFVQAVERAGQSQRGLSPHDVIVNGRGYVLRLGFEAATTSGTPGLMGCHGDGSIVPADETVEAPPSGHVEVTDWRSDAAGELYSASAIEPSSQTVFTGWTTTPPERAQVEALAALVAQVSSGYELAELLQSARHEADHDALTGLKNRGAFDRHLDQMCAKDDPVAMLFVDVDHFKQINDTLGHAAGDQILRELSRTMIDLVADEHASVGRYGGDEFVLALEGATAERAEHIAVGLQHAFASRLTNESSEIPVGVSIGVAMAHGPISPSVLTRNADRALYAAKEAGRGTTRIARCSPPSNRQVQANRAPTA